MLNGMSDRIGLPENVKLPPTTGSVKRVVVDFPLWNSQYPFYFDIDKPLQEVVKRFCESNKIPDFMKYSFKNAKTGLYLTDVSKRYLSDGQFLTLSESCLSAATRLSYAVKNEMPSLESLSDTIDLLRSHEFAHHFLSMEGAKHLNDFVIKENQIRANVVKALHCLSVMLESGDKKSAMDWKVLGALTGQLQKQHDIIPNSPTANYIAYAFKVLGLYLAGDPVNAIAKISPNIHYIAASYVDKDYPVGVTSAALTFLYRFLILCPGKLLELLNGKPPACINFRKILVAVAPQIYTSPDVARYATELLVKIMDKEMCDWSDLKNIPDKVAGYKNSIAALVDESFQSSEMKNILLFSDLCDFPDQDFPTLMTLSLIQFAFLNGKKMIDRLKSYNFNFAFTEQQRRIPLGYLAFKLCHYLYESIFQSFSLDSALIRVAFCCTCESVDESSYNFITVKLLDLAISTWIQMEGGITPVDTVVAVIQEQVKGIFESKLKKGTEAELDKLIQASTYEQIRRKWLLQQIERVETIKQGKEAKKFRTDVEVRVIDLLKRQRLNALTHGKAFQKVPRTQLPEWPCRYFMLSPTSNELRYQEVDEDNWERPFPIYSLQYGIEKRDIRKIMDGEEMARQPRNIDLNYVFGMHRVVPKETESESTDREEKFFFQASDFKTCITWKDGLRIFIDPDIEIVSFFLKLFSDFFFKKLSFNQKYLSKEFQNEVEQLVRMEVMVKLVELS